MSTPTAQPTPDARPVVHIVDDDQAVRESLVFLMGSVGLDTAAYPDAHAFLAQYHPHRPGCLLLDVRMPGLSGLDLQEELRRREIQTPVIFITGHGDVPMAVRAMKRGASDFIEKPFNDQTLLDAVHRALALAIERFNLLHSRAEAQRRMGSLTAREREVLELVVTGNSNKEIALLLEISVKTVETHRARVMEKMAVNSLADLVRLAVTSRHPE